MTEGTRTMAALMEERAKGALDALGWHLETRSGMRLKVEDSGGVGTLTCDEAVMYDALHDIAHSEPRPVAGESFLSQLRRVNTDRYHAWVGDAQDAGILFDAAELGGEVGELLNVVKKLEREERGWRGSRAAPEDFADECADVLICLDKLARRRGVDLEAATIAKFNATSDKVDLPHKLATHSPAPTEAGEGGQDRKFAFRDGQFVNRVSGEPIPHDEPIIIFRARDNHSLPVLREYLSMAADPHHRQAIKDRMSEFAAWRLEHPDRVKEPGITHHIRLNADDASMQGGAEG